MIQEPSRRRSHRGTLSRFRDLMRSCREKSAKSFASLYALMLDDIDEILLGLADKAESDAARTEIFEATQELQLRRLSIEQGFFEAITEGFSHFDQGKIESIKSDRGEQKLGPLSLVDKDDFEVTVVLTNIVTNAQHKFSEQLYGLNQRLAVINGGTKLGETSGAFPGGPRHLCEAFIVSIDSTEIPLRIETALLNAFSRYVVNQAGALYEEFNASLVRAGVLPNLTLGVAEGYSQSGGGTSSAVSEDVEPGAIPDQEQVQDKAVSSPNEQYEAELTGPSSAVDNDLEDQALKQELFRGISEILSHRRQRTPAVTSIATASTGGMQSNSSIRTTDLASLVVELNRLQQTSVPYVVQTAPDLSITSIKEAFTEQIAKLGDIIQHQPVNNADADMIDLVGMIFEVILDDENLPDVVKALLSHLHTPFLKIAILDKKFFVRSQHPARKLLNGMSQAGTLCGMNDSASLNIIAKMREVVNKILEEFNEDLDIFSALLDDFTSFMAAHNRRSAITEKRTVEAAKGRDKLQTARRTVSHEIVTRLVDHKVARVVESLLMGPWANYLVIVLLRSGEESQEWLSALGVTDDLIWSVEHKQTDEDRTLLRLKLPKIVEMVRAGLDLAGDTDVDGNTLLRDLEACHKSALATPRAVAQSKSGQSVEAELFESATKSPQTLSSMADRLEKLKEIVPVEWQQVLSQEANELEEKTSASPEKQALLDSLRTLEFGTWFEFVDKEKDITQRGKLAWINTTTSNYMFVNQGGRQIAIKSLHNLADELKEGTAKIVDTEKTPFVDRALKSIHGFLSKEPIQSSVG